MTEYKVAQRQFEKVKGIFDELSFFSNKKEINTRSISSPWRTPKLYLFTLAFAVAEVGLLADFSGFRLWYFSIGSLAMIITGTLFIWTVNLNQEELIHRVRVRTGEKVEGIGTFEVFALETSTLSIDILRGSKEFTELQIRKKQLLGFDNFGAVVLLFAIPFYVNVLSNQFEERTDLYEQINFIAERIVVAFALVSFFNIVKLFVEFRTTNLKSLLNHIDFAIINRGLGDSKKGRMKKWRTVRSRRFRNGV